MHSLLNSLRKRTYTSRLTSARARRTWSGAPWNDLNDIRSIACVQCPKFSVRNSICSVPFGSPLRKCVTAAQEAHLHSLEGRDLLEIGFGKHSIPRRLVTSAGGTWTGIDPLGRDETARVGAACRGDVGNIPFPDNRFDVVAGVQTLEHWSDPLPDGSPPPGYSKGLAEVHRVLRPGGFIYLDAPVHLHGHEMFILGDIEKIRALFSSELWTDVVVEAWRREHKPLDRYATPAADQATWPASVSAGRHSELETIRQSASVWLLVVTASKR